MARSKGGLQGAASFLSNATVFWLSHLAIGQVDLASVLAHLLLLIRLIEEHSVSYASSYLNCLLIELLEKQKASVFVDVSEFISSRQDRILTRLDLKLGSRPARVDKLGARDKGAGRGGLVKDKAPGKVKGGKPSVAAPARVQAGSRPPAVPSPASGKGGARQQICFSENTLEDKKCSNTSCPRLHLDTRLPADLDRFLNAKKTYDAALARGKPGSSG